MLFPTTVNPYFRDHLIVTLGNFDGLILYKAFRIPTGETAVAYAAEAVRAAERVVRQFDMVRNGRLDPTTIGVVSWQLDSALASSVLYGAIGAGAALSAAYLGAGIGAILARSFSFSFSFGF